MDKKHCSGCRNNFYNDNNQYGVKECWSLKNAKLVSRLLISSSEPPPFLDKKAVIVPNCKCGNSMNYIELNRIDSNGYWK